MKQKKFFWERKDGTNFDETPFTVDKHTVFDCQYGSKYFKGKESKHARLRLQGMRKIGCCAHIRITQFTLFTNYQISSMEKQGLSSWKLRKLRETKLACLRKELEDGTPNTKVIYFVSLPSNQAHSSHPTGPDIAFAQKVHPLLIAKISELVLSNICDIYEVKKILQYYTNNEISKELGFKPNENDRAFYSDMSDIKNHIYKAKRTLELSKIDQENLRLKVNEWTANGSENKFFFRPYIEGSGNDEQIFVSESEVKEKVVGTDTFCGNSGCDDNWCEVLGCSKQYSQSFLYVHQTP